MGEVEFEEGFGGGEFDEFVFAVGSLLKEAVVASAAELGEAGEAGIGLSITGYASLVLGGSKSSVSSVKITFGSVIL